MFQIGAINPTIADQRRQQLLQQLAQQYMQRKGPGMPGQPGLPPQVQMPWQRRQQHPNIAAQSGRFDPTAREGSTTLTGMDQIPANVAAALGPGGSGRPGVGSPSPGVPPQVSPGPAAGQPGPPPGVGVPGSAAAGTHGPGQGVPAAGVPVAPPPQTTAALGQAIAGIAPTIDPALLSGLANNLIPLGAGSYYNPATGAVHGIGGIGRASAF